MSAATFTTPMKGLVLIRARYGSIVARRPWADQWRKLESEMNRTDTIDQAQRFMVEFLGSVSGFGALPISNVVLASDFNDRSRGAATQSFVYQELVAVLSAAPAPPWSLVDPSQIAKYINFLRSQIDDYAIDKPLKAVKRALSLAHTIRLQEFVNGALDILVSPQSVAYIRFSRKREVSEKSADCTDYERGVVWDSVDAFSAEAVEDKKSRESLLDEFTWAMRELRKPVKKRT